MKRFDFIFGFAFLERKSVGHPQANAEVRSSRFGHECSSCIPYKREEPSRQFTRLDNPKNSAPKHVLDGALSAVTYCTVAVHHYYRGEYYLIHTEECAIEREPPSRIGLIYNFPARSGSSFSRRVGFHLSVSRVRSRRPRYRRLARCDLSPCPLGQAHFPK